MQPVPLMNAKTAEYLKEALDHWERENGSNPNNAIVEFRVWNELFSDTAGPFEAILVGSAFTNFVMTHIFWTHLDADGDTRLKISEYGNGKIVRVFPGPHNFERTTSWSAKYLELNNK